MLAMWAGPGGVSAPRLRAGGAVHCWKMDFTEAYSDTCSAAGLAAREGNVELLKALIKKGHSLDIADNRGWYPIHEAASHTTLKCLRLLLHKASLTSGVELKTYEGETALHLAAKHGHLKIVQILLQAGANPNAVTNENVTPLFLAAEKGHIAIVRTLLKNEARINGAHSACLWSLVHQAAYQGHLDVLKFLLEKGADKESKDDYGITPLFLAAQYGKVESLRTLIQHGSNVNCQAYDKATPLFIAAQEGHVECVEVLLSHGVDANLYCNEDDWQLPIHAAAQMGQVKVLEFLIPITDRICDKGTDKVSPVYSAVYGGQQECLKMLLQSGYSPDAQECPLYECLSPLCMAFSQRFFAIIYMLLKAGAVITGLHYCYCLQYQCFHLLRFLLEQGYPLPSGAHLAGIVKYGLLSEQQFKQWLPHLLLAGLDPLDLLTEAWLNTAGDRMLHFVLEFTNWKRLPLSVDQIIFCRNASSTCVEQQHFDEIPPLAHLSRLKIRSALESEQLRSDQRIRQLPLPSCLHDFLLYKDVLKLYGIPEISENQEELKTVISSIKNLEN
ncbi:ankyrin repeat and SOCS box protein 3 isoform X1 [Leucoraja erinacea]|uniref:ankyrin repeat and SOCS box protein 3 isoform X1 n=2 Tax=Leucoraja erinaceus TaxID=7782 RepID=UPI002456052A|nr:ankyrin repeat and SOCS box protein 3 isoform X1 [Leucoraja erinacea]